MNLYFWLFFLYALWIVPVSITASVRVGKGIRHHTWIRVAGIPIGKADPSQEEKTLRKSEVARGIFTLDAPLVLALIRKGHIRRAFGTLRLENIWLHMRISFSDAAATAMSYAALRVLLQTVLPCLAAKERLQGRVNMDFDAQGSEVFIRCIFSARMGMLIAAVLRLGMAVIRERAERLKPEEEPYAAASH